MNVSLLTFYAPLMSNHLQWEHADSAQMGQSAQTQNPQSAKTLEIEREIYHHIFLYFYL